MDALVRVMEHYPGQYELRDTAGLHQLYRSDKLSSAPEILRQHYEESHG